MIRLVAPLCALALLLTACGDKSAGTGAQPLTPTSESPPISSTTTVPPSTSPGVPRCSAATLSGTIQPADAGAGNRYATLVVTAKSRCTLYGYGGLQLVDTQGKPTPTNLVRTPNPGPALVTLQPGQTAHKTLHWTVVPTGDEPVTGPCEPSSAGATVIPPDETQPFTVIYEFGPVCDHGRIEGSAYFKP
ncbi:MAG TPA: DUF4232 domain-containing protein [Actinophytocola sp.]|uniref:DUF4232 domain-containing protein n=1 Tax=Actinophytocola sp. TaxID=1872138 RepID=UPI002E07D673|nr:DUF4232 domain-containing protein [Actinophytocola sp.]